MQYSHLGVGPYLHGTKGVLGLVHGVSLLEIATYKRSDYNFVRIFDS